jgi:hypothetical protein
MQTSHVRLEQESHEELVVNLMQQDSRQQNWGVRNAHFGGR